MIDLRQGDCLDVMATLSDGSVDLILTSPPYDGLRKYGSGHTFDFPGVADQCKRLLKPGGVIAWVVGDQTKDGSESGTSFRQVLHFMALGLRLHDTMIYRKANPVPLTHNRYEQEFEFMFVLAKGRPRVANILTEPCTWAGVVKPYATFYRDGETLSIKSGSANPVKERKQRGNVWVYGNGGNRKDNAGHPAAFPLQLATDHILSWTDPGDTVLDCFSGSGTTGVACLNTGRNFIGIEKDPGYFALGDSRIADERAKGAC